MGGTVVKTYDPKKVKINFGGVPISGFADGTFVKITPSADRFSRKVGADGEVARSRGNDDTSEVSITLMMTSASNKILSSFMIADRLSNLGAKPLLVTDIYGGTIGFWQSAWIKKPPEVGYGKEIDNREWVFDTAQVVEELIAGDLPL